MTETAAPAAPTGSRAAGWGWALLTVLLIPLQLFSLRAAQSLRLHLHLQLALWLAAGGVWLLSLWLVRRARPLSDSRWAVALLIVTALALRLPALSLPLGHSDDAYRYLWDGLVQTQGHSPYAGPPDAPAYASVAATYPELHTRINHRHLPTIYPPLAELSFRLQAQLAPQAPWTLAAALRTWKAWMLAADLLVLALLLLLCHRRGQDLRLAAMWATAPLTATELALNGHLEALGIAPLLAALLLWPRSTSTPKHPQVHTQTPPAAGTPQKSGEDRLGWLLALLCGGLLAAAALVKPVALAVTPAALLLRRRSQVALLLGAGVVGVALLLPYALHGPIMGSLGEYGRRWRTNDGLYALIQLLAEGLVKLLYRPPHYEPWRFAALAQLISGRPRATVWPDELAAAVARGLVLLLLLLLTRWTIKRRLSAVQTGLVLLLGYQLLTPTLHPWYMLWPLALCPLWPRLSWPILLMAALSPLAYLPLPGYWAGQPFVESAWPRILQHGAGLMALLWIDPDGVRGTLRRAVTRRDGLRFLTSCVLGLGATSLGLAADPSVASAAPLLAVVHFQPSTGELLESTRTSRLGYVRTENGVLPIAPPLLDPRKDALLVLVPQGDKTPALTTPAAPTSVELRLYGLRILPAVSVVAAGATVTIRNEDRLPLTLRCPQAPSLLPKEPLPPGGKLQVTLPPGAEFTVESPDYPHLRASLLNPSGLATKLNISELGTVGLSRLDIPAGDYEAQVLLAGRVTSTQKLTIGAQGAELVMYVPPRLSSSSKPETGAPK